jgi:hypothetical protein
VPPSLLARAAELQRDHNALRGVSQVVIVPIRRHAP